MDYHLCKCMYIYVVKLLHIVSHRLFQWEGAHDGGTAMWTICTLATVHTREWGRWRWQSDLQRRIHVRFWANRWSLISSLLWSFYCMMIAIILAYVVIVDDCRMFVWNGWFQPDMSRVKLCVHRIWCAHYYSFVFVTLLRKIRKVELEEVDIYTEMTVALYFWLFATFNYVPYWVYEIIPFIQLWWLETWTHFACIKVPSNSGVKTQKYAALVEKCICHNCLPHLHTPRLWSQVTQTPLNISWWIYANTMLDL